MVRWSSSKEGKVLASLFENGIADPRFSKPADIDPIKEMRDEFKEFSPQQFRNNYKTTSSNWMAGKALEGQRFKALDRELFDLFICYIDPVPFHSYRFYCLF